MTLSADHTPNVSVTVLLESLSTPQAGFGTVTLLVDQAQGTGNALGGSSPRYVDLADVDEAQALRDAGHISAEVMAACTTAFSQTPQPSKFRLCRVDTGGAETYTDALTALMATDAASDVWALCMDSRTAATQMALESTSETRKDVFLLIQSSDADWITSGLPSAYSATADRVYSGGVYHDKAAEWADVAAAVRWLTFDPEETSAPGEGSLADVEGYTTRLSATQRGYAIGNNMAVLGTWGSSDYWLDNVVNHEGRPVYEMLTAAFFKARVSEDIQTLHQREATRGRKIPVSVAGQRQVQIPIESRLQSMLTAGHILDYLVTPQSITDADRAARRVRHEVQYQTAVGARTFVVGTYASTSPIVTEI